MAIRDLVTTQEAAEMIGVNDSRVRQFHRGGRLTGKRVGTVLLFDREEVERFSQKNRPNGRPNRADKKTG